jgi:regulator of replication initiation timing
MNDQTEKYLAIMLESYENQLQQVEDGITKLEAHLNQMVEQQNAFTQDIETIRELLGLEAETDETREAASELSLVTEEESVSE